MSLQQQKDRSKTGRGSELVCVSLESDSEPVSSRMELTALCFSLMMTEMILLSGRHHEVYAASLRIDPNRSQFFEYESVTFYCDRCLRCLLVHESRGTIQNKNSTNQQNAAETSYVIKNTYGHDSGKYWCEAGGDRSNSVNITVTDGSVMLEVPALPVMEGDAVTLRCRNRTASSPSAHFYKDGVFISSSSTGNVTIHRVSSLHEGLYGCSISGAAASAQSRLVVGSRQREPGSPLEPGPPASSHTPWVVVTVLLVLLLLVVALGHFTHRVRRLSRPGSGSTDHTAAEGAGDASFAAAANTVTYAVMRKNRKTPDGSSSLAVYYMLGGDDAEELERVGSAGTDPPPADDNFYSTIQFLRRNWLKEKLRNTLSSLNKQFQPV
ncbi:uncharacterized protein LOC114843833 [Betta splendens]|uniref:Uncharacterized protein LOC114843833 n=1 Tax=Betta splendens TaxID=158456 RepID=A0A9W2XBG2_BETSP|nr:uncharacterized protein LOC114843833 [Betta splendens]